MKKVLLLSTILFLLLMLVSCTNKQETTSISSYKSFDEASLLSSDSITFENIDTTSIEKADDYDETEAEAFANSFFKSYLNVNELINAKKDMTAKLFNKGKAIFRHDIPCPGEDSFFNITRSESKQSEFLVKNLGKKEFELKACEASIYDGDNGYFIITARIKVDKLDGVYKVVNLYHFFNKSWLLE